MRRHAPIAMLIATLLAGCQSAGDRAFLQANADCTAPGDNRSSIECVKNHPNFAQFSPDAQRYVHYSAAVHEQRRAGKLTMNEADMLTSEYIAGINRDRASVAAAQSQAASAAMAQAGAALMIAGAPRPASVYRPPPTPMFRQTNCNAMGNSLSCTTF